ncbi:MAG: hypothetical protein AB4426_24290 [Xenococcaceae cyanobacterium]
MNQAIQITTSKGSKEALRPFNWMYKSIYWLMGDSFARSLFGTLRWANTMDCRLIFRIQRAYGQPGVTLRAVIAELNMAIAHESLLSMKETLLRLEQTAITQDAYTQGIQELYETKVQELRVCEQELIEISDTSEDFYVLQVRQMQLQQLVPHLKRQLEQADRFVQAAHHKLRQEQCKLKEHEADMQNMQDLAKVDQTLASMAKTNRALRTDSARLRFEAAKGAFQRQMQKSLPSTMTEDLLPDFNLEAVCLDAHHVSKTAEPA